MGSFNKWKPTTLLFLFFLFFSGGGAGGVLWGTVPDFQAVPTKLRKIRWMRCWTASCTRYALLQSLSIWPPLVLPLCVLLVELGSVFEPRDFSIRFALEIDLTRELNLNLDQMTPVGVEAPLQGGVLAGMSPPSRNWFGVPLTHSPPWEHLGAAIKLGPPWTGVLVHNMYIHLYVVYLCMSHHQVRGMPGGGGGGGESLQPHTHLSLAVVLFFPLLFFSRFCLPTGQPQKGLPC